MENDIFLRRSRFNSAPAASQPASQPASRLEPRSYVLFLAVFDEQAGAHMKLAGPVPNTSVHFWPPGGGAHDIGRGQGNVLAYIFGRRGGRT